MWQIICLCLPQMTKDERQRFLEFFGSVVRDSNRELGEVDLGLSFLYTLTPKEAQIVLEERYDLVTRSQELIEVQQRNRKTTGGTMHLLVLDHIRTLLEAERSWLERTIHHLSSSEMVESEATHHNNQSRSVY